MQQSIDFNSDIPPPPLKILKMNFCTIIIILTLQRPIGQQGTHKSDALFFKDATSYLLRYAFYILRRQSTNTST